MIEALLKSSLKVLGSINNQQPSVKTTDKYRATEIVSTELIYSGDIWCKASHQMVK